MSLSFIQLHHSTDKSQTTVTLRHTGARKFEQPVTLTLHPDVDIPIIEAAVAPTRGLEVLRLDS